MRRVMTREVVLLAALIGVAPAFLVASSLRLKASGGEGAGGPMTCPPTPLYGCLEAQRTSLLIKDNGDVGPSATDKLKWKWVKGPLVMQSDFGDPTATAEYRMCLYAGTAGVAAVELNVPAGPNWSVLSTKGYRYKDTTLAADGVSGLMLKGGSEGSSKILLKAKGQDFPIPALPLAASTDVVIQLANTDNANCWQAVFPPAAVQCTDRKCKGKATPLPAAPSPTRTSTPTRTRTPTASATPTVTATPTITPTCTPLPTRTFTPSATATATQTPTPTPTSTVTGSPTDTWTPNGTATPCTVKITDENDVELTGTVAATVGILDEFKAAVTPAGVCGTCAYQWTIAGHGAPGRDVAIKTYKHVMADYFPNPGTGKHDWTHEPQWLVAGDLRTKDVDFFWTKEQGPILKVTVSTASGTTCTAQITMDVKHAKDGANVDPNRVIYAKSSPDVKHNPDGMGGFYEALKSHGEWHLADGNVAGNRHCRIGGAACTMHAQCAGAGNFCQIDQHYDSGLFSKTMLGDKFFTYHDGIIAQQLAWRDTFNVTTPIDPTSGPVPTAAKFCNGGDFLGFSCTADDTGSNGCPGATCPGCCLAQTFLTVQGGSAPSPSYGYVRLGEFADTEHLGDEMEPWHGLGHGQLGVDMNGQYTALKQGNNVFWGWHTRIAQFRNDFLAINHVADRAAVVATVPCAGDIGVPNTTTVIKVTFDRPVSVGAPADNTAQVTKTALTITPPGGGAPFTATAVASTDYRTHTFTVPQLATAGVYSVNLTGTERGYLGPGNGNAYSFSFTVAAP